MKELKLPSDESVLVANDIEFCRFLFNNKEVIAEQQNLPIEGEIIQALDPSLSGLNEALDNLLANITKSKSPNAD